MKRLLSAAIVALGIHGLLMSMDFGWMNLTDVEKPSTGSVTIVLESFQPQTIKSPLAPPSAIPNPREVKRDDVETTPKQKLPSPPPVEQRPVEAARKPEKKTPIAKSAPVKQRQPVETKDPAPPEPAPLDISESVPDESSQEAGASMPLPQEMTPVLDTGPVAAVSNQPAQPPVLEDAMPDYSNNPPIVYPRRARQKGYEGTVVLEVLVDRDGKVDDLRILASSGYGILDRSAVKSVKAWSFTPAKKGSGTIDMWIKVPIRFNLK